MTQVTPPGWYPDPGQTSDGPRTERWWDGSAWTQSVRPAETAAGWGPPGYPPGASVPPQGRRRRLRTAIGTVVVLAVLAGIGGGVYALTSGNGKDTASSRPSPAPSHQGGGGAPDRPGIPGAPGAPGGPGAPGPGRGGEDGYATDPLSGISLPVLDGWQGESLTVGAQVTTGPYKCPGDGTQQCVRGGASSSPAAALKLKQSTPKAVAEADIARNAEDSYGGKVYGKISSHQQLAARAVTVAGEKGYLVRWKVATSKGDDGYVESLAFPSPASQDVLVVVRFGFDVNPAAPKVDTMDKITEGIKKAARTSGGNGKKV